MPINAPQNRAQLAGVPSQWNDSITGSHAHLLAGDTPLVVTKDLPLALNQTILAYTPVKWNAGGTGLVPATNDAPAIGITLKDMVVGASGDLPGTPILINGCLNVDALTWPAGFTTEAQKMAAFNGAPTPTLITLRKVRRGSVVAQP